MVENSQVTPIKNGYHGGSQDLTTVDGLHMNIAPLPEDAMIQPQMKQMTFEQ